MLRRLGRRAPDPRKDAEWLLPPGLHERDAEVTSEDEDTLANSGLHLREDKERGTVTKTQVSDLSPDGPQREAEAERKCT